MRQNLHNYTQQASVCSNGSAAVYFFIRCGAILLGAFLFALSFPNFFNKDGFSFFAFFFFVPTLFVIKQTPLSHLPFYGFLFGLISYLLFSYWIFNFHKLALLLVILGEALYHALLFFFIGTIFFVLKKIGTNKRWKSVYPIFYLVSVLFFIPLIYLIYEVIKNSGFLGYPYGTIAYSHYQHFFMRELSGLTSIYFVGMFIVFINVLLFFFLDKWHELKRLGYLGAAILFVPLLILSSFFSLQYDKKFVKNDTAPDCFKILAVQSNQGIVDKSKWYRGIPKIDSNYKKSTNYSEDLELLLKLTKKGLEQYQGEKKPNLIVWSETAFVPSVDWYSRYKSIHSELVDRLLSFQKEISIPLLLGNSHGEVGLFSSSPKKYKRYDYNSALLINEGQIVSIYKKNKLVPFSEAYPFKNAFPNFKAFLEDKLDCSFWSRGEKNQAPFFLHHKGQPLFFSVNICYEDCFASYVKQNSKRVSFIINLTNDSWAGSYASQHQHLAFSQFRANENRLWVVRVSQSGVSCLINKQGCIVKEIAEFEKGVSLFELNIP